jgi:SAM-dependent methyltransferase/FMN phosphatase YigB (HAD superfamily)
VDLACGLGYGSAMLARQFPGATVIGVDNSEFAIEYARLSFGAILPNLEFHQANAGDTAWLGSRRVNALVSFETIEHIPDPDGFLRTMTRHMPTDGRFIGSVPNSWVDETGKDPNPFHLHVFDLEKFRALVESHFQSLQVFRQNAERGFKGDHGRILKPLPSGKPTPDDAQNAEWCLIAAEGLVKPKIEIAPINHRPLSKSGATPVRRLCLATCFLPPDNGNWRWLKDYQDALSEQDFELVVLSCAASPYPEIRTVILPLWLHGYGQAYGVSAEGVTLESPLITALAQRDRAWSTQESRPLGEFTDGLSVCQCVLRNLLEELQPSAVLIWSDILPQSIVLQHLAQQRGVPCWTIERGLLPETLMVEMTGQVGQSELNRSFTLSRVMRHSTETNLFAVAQKAYLAAGRTKYAQAKALSPEEFQAQFNPKGVKLVAALLQFDVASNYFPTEYPSARIHQNGFASSRDAIRELAAAAAESGCMVIAKPHPLDREDYSTLENAHLRVVREVNLHSLIRAADVVACMASSTQFEALLHEKPILLLARSPLANKGVAYEPQTAADLPSALRAALERRDFEKQMEAGRRFIDFLLRYFSIALTETSNAVPTLRDFASFVVRNSIETDCALDGNERLHRVGGQLNAWESAAKDGLKSKSQPLRRQQLENLAPEPVKISAPDSLWRLDESLRETGELLQGRASGVRVVSFDFFDTLICRTCADPSDLFVEVGRRLSANGLLVREITPMEFHSARTAADERARKNARKQGRFPEIKLADIYAELKNVVNNVTAASAVEFEVERAYCHINPAMLSLLQHVKSLGYAVAMISDTYFTMAQLKQLLRENGCAPDEFDAFFVSCERGKAKWNGQLYQDLLAI